MADNATRERGQATLLGVAIGFYLLSGGKGTLALLSELGVPPWESLAIAVIATCVAVRRLWIDAVYPWRPNTKWTRVQDVVAGLMFFATLLGLLPKA